VTPHGDKALTRGPRHGKEEVDGWDTAAYNS
jgi:hypothetical protein